MTDLARGDATTTGPSSDPTFRLDAAFLASAGLAALREADAHSLLAFIYNQLELRVGLGLAQQMSDGEPTEFEGYVDRDDDEGALTWLQMHQPNYAAIVRDELERLRSELRMAAPRILSALQT